MAGSRIFLLRFQVQILGFMILCLEGEGERWSERRTKK
jgi:hypothetical protein